MSGRSDPSALWESPDDRLFFRATFDEDPDAYDRTRPVCPPQVFDDVVELAGLQPGRRILEIGPGTGQATRPLAERGLAVVAVELGPRLAERARANLRGFDAVTVFTGSFEQWDPAGERFDAVFSCNAFHWVDPDVRFAKAAAVLRPGGHLIVIATPWVVPDDADSFWWEVQDDYVAIGGERFDPATAHPDRVRDLSPSVIASGYFRDPVSRRYRFDVEFSVSDYLANLSTQSGIKRFGVAQRRELLERVRRRIEARGATLRAHLLSVLTVAEVR